ncbi:hypothetical protein KC343_g4375 [Hortaea werneckii]|uniref:histidine kinase n=1 Tax=Hortaea werneckii TaxID=91943 RepID=A0A3M7FUA3_HORWE|nr:hypothetical protein KC352_g8156 [Hortaea werneckii]KAI7569875.1 hypothetical protein KC317_g2942 [Hortaea werneckii]KAI7623845.1 hypothetical protein KC346_g2511 [Hortaea werneckii]KAI7630850.1 hypothetical protein KC343_g4375 [Hortaea werneckii]KAI7679985.1 hypothetical protein KC319_g2440 [Hortaea werneckii]
MTENTAEHDARPGLQRSEPSEEQEDSYFMRPRTEGARERDVFRYLHPWAEANQPAFISRAAFPDDQNTPEPEACPDITLAALAQLGALRMNVRRVVVSLISCTVEYVLAESTPSMSLQYDVVEDPRDAPWIGTCSLKRSEGLNDLAVDHWRKATHLRQLPEDPGFYYTAGVSKHHFIIPDVHSQKDERQRAFVKRASWLRFFASVPLRDPHGSVIGSYTLLDDRPRFGISARELTYLEDMADTVTDHLEATIVRAQRQRSERLIQGLALFNDGRDSLRHWWLQQDEKRLNKAGRYRKQNIDRSGQDRRLAAEFGIQESNDRPLAQRRLARLRRGRGRNATLGTSGSNSAAEKTRESENVGRRDFGQEAPKADSSRASSRSQDPLKSSRQQKEDKGTPRDKKNTPTLSATNPTHAYGRASNLLREALHAEGVYFVDANMATPTPRRPRIKGSDPQSEQSEGTSTTSASERHPGSTSDTDASDKDSNDRLCDLNGFSSRKRSTIKGTESEYLLNLPVKRLESLIRRFPHGHIFNYEASGEVLSSSGDETGSVGSSENTDPSPVPDSRTNRKDRDAQKLGQIMPGARTIAFFPVWDNGSERYRTCLFVWSMTPLRYFDPAEDMTYLTAFSHSLLAELGRIEAMAADRAKSTFISSMSHELRSPLHGVLAGAEFLMESEPTAFQEQMISTISMAGRTLLDTVNHILDFSKISNFSKSQRRDRAKADASRHGASIAGDETEIGVTMRLDIARLTEEVVETVASAYRFKGRPSSSAQANTKPTETESSAERSNSEARHIEVLSIILDIAWRRTWVIDISPGSWTRIITNLVSNALKYTPKGTVTIKLQSGDVTTTTDGQERADITLIVEDTGIGMSPTFLSQGLYTPFRQVDSHSTGTGLGLSIVKQICEDIGARLKVDSELQRGTRVSITLSALFPQRHESTDGTTSDNRLFDNVNQLCIERFLLYYPLIDESHDEARRVLAVTNSVKSIARQWLPSELSINNFSDLRDGVSICAVAEADLKWLAHNDPAQYKELFSNLQEKQASLLVLAPSLRAISSNLEFKDAPVNVFFVPQAIGPRKLLRFLVAAQEAKGHSSRSQETGNSSRRPSLTGNLPIQTQDPSSAKAPAKAKVPADGQDGSIVLLVEDNEINMKLLIALMKKLKLHYECAENGQQALDMYSSNPSKYFLIMMDLSMPVMDGFDSTAQIREVEKKRKLQRCTVVALTGATSGEERDGAIRSGVDRVITKPVRMTDLSTIVNEAQK